MTKEEKQLLLIDLCGRINSERWMSLENYPGEEWKNISGYGDRYMVSNIGRVKTKEFTYTIHGKIQIKSEHIIKTIIRKDGYCKVNLGGFRSQKNIEFT